jgi:hypothetical protein
MGFSVSCSTVRGRPFPPLYPVDFAAIQKLRNGNDLEVSPLYRLVLYEDRFNEANKKNFGQKQFTLLATFH